MKAIGIKMVELTDMTAAEALAKGYRVNDKSENTLGYEVTYDSGYKSWSPKEVADAAYFILDEKNDGSMILQEDVEKFITNVDVITAGDKTTVVNVHTLTGFDTIRHSSCVDPKNHSEEFGKKHAMEDAFNSIWVHLVFVLQWAKYGLKGNK